MENKTQILINGIRINLTEKLYSSIKRKAAVKLEKENYKKMSSVVKKRYTVESFVKEQVPGRMFMTGDRSSEVFLECDDKYRKHLIKTAVQISKNIETANEIVDDVFMAFYRRERYNYNKKLARKKLDLDSLERKFKEKERNYNISKEELSSLKEEIIALKAEVNELEEQNELEIIALINSYDGLDIEEVIEMEKNLLIKRSVDAGIKDDPILSYINHSVMRKAQMEYTKKSNGKGTIVASMFANEENGADGDKILEKMFFQNNLNGRIEDSYVNEIDNISDDYEITEEFYNRKLVSHDNATRIAMVKKIISDSSRNSKVMNEFIFGELSHEDIKEKFGLNCAGASKSIVTRKRADIVKKIALIQETELIRNKEKTSGTVTYFYENSDQIKCTADVLNNKWHGESIEFYPDGKIKSTKTYNNGVLDGKYEEYYDNGVLKVKGTFVTGQKNGEWKRVERNRVMSEKITYMDNDNYIFEIYNDLGNLETIGYQKTADGKTEIKESTVLGNVIDYKSTKLKIVDDKKECCSMCYFWNNDCCQKPSDVSENCYKHDRIDGKNIYFIEIV